MTRTTHHQERRKTPRRDQKSMTTPRREDKNQELVRKLALLPGNKECMDCTQKGPPYVVTEFGIFVCSTCAGIHRSHQFHCKGISMTKFKDEEVERLEKQGGNERAMLIWRAKWKPTDYPKPKPGDERAIKDFIFKTYVEKKWANSSANVAASAASGSSSSASSSSARGGPSSSPNASSATTTYHQSNFTSAPSSRLNGTSSSSSSSSSSSHSDASNSRAGNTASSTRSTTPPPKPEPLTNLLPDVPKLSIERKDSARTSLGGGLLPPPSSAAASKSQDASATIHSQPPLGSTAPPAPATTTTTAPATAPSTGQPQPQTGDLLQFFGSNSDQPSDQGFANFDNVSDGASGAPNKSGKDLADVLFSGLNSVPPINAAPAWPYAAAAPSAGPANVSVAPPAVNGPWGVAAPVNAASAPPPNWNVQGHAAVYPNFNPFASVMQPGAGVYYGAPNVYAPAGFAGPQQGYVQGSGQVPANVYGTAYAAPPQPLSYGVAAAAAAPPGYAAAPVARPSYSATVPMGGMQPTAPPKDPFSNLMSADQFGRAAPPKPLAPTPDPSALSANNAWGSSGATNTSNASTTTFNPFQ